MNQFLSEIQEKYMKIVKSANLIGFLNRLVYPSILTDSQPFDTFPPKNKSFSIKLFNGNPTNGYKRNVGYGY